MSPNSPTPLLVTTSITRIWGYFPGIVYAHQQRCGVDFKVLVNLIQYSKTKQNKQKNPKQNKTNKQKTLKSQQLWLFLLKELS